MTSLIHAKQIKVFVLLVGYLNGVKNTIPVSQKIRVGFIICELKKNQIQVLCAMFHFFITVRVATAYAHSLFIKLANIPHADISLL